MISKILALVLLLCGALATALPNAACTNPLVRKEWRTLDKSVQTEYLKAVVCLTKKAAITPSSVAAGAKNRIDDFVATHIIQFMNIHFVGQFLPWHRYYLVTYETALRTECGYTGAQPYWDWTLDATTADFPKSPIWDATYGFGGNGPYVNAPGGPSAIPGRTGGGCVPNGPFKDMVVGLGPQQSLRSNPRCLSRDFSPLFAQRNSNASLAKITLSKTDFGHFVRTMEGNLGGALIDAGSIHAGGHYSVGGQMGQMGDPYVSPADPVFYLHHANLDRVWWSWQKKDLTRRLTDISGPLHFNDYANQQGGNATLSTRFDLGYNAPSVSISDMMNINGNTLCYDYDNLYTV